MELLDLLNSKREHMERLANQGGAAGEATLVEATTNWVDRPRGKAMKNLLQALREEGIQIKWSSFDAIALPGDRTIDFSDLAEIRRLLPELTFIEIKTASQDRVENDFSGFFFALTESEIHAAEQLGPRHKVALFNKNTGEILITSVPEIVERAKSTTWQVSIQL